MNTELLTTGETLTYPDPPPEVAAFLARVRSAATDPTVTVDGLIELIFGVGNPLLDTTILPGRAMVTQKAFDNPVYHILTDLLFRKELAVRNMPPEVVAATHTVSVKDAARQLGITESSVRAAITARKLAGWMRNGQWYLRSESIASYKVSNRGRKKRTPAVAKTSVPKRAAKRKAAAK